MKMLDKHSNQQKEEKEITEKFLKTAGIKIQSNGIRSLVPPSPDVLCTLVDGKSIAFELTTTVDPNLARNVKFAHSVKIEMRNYMFYNMASCDKAKLERIFGNADLYFKFNNGISKSKFMKLRPALFQTLLKCSSHTIGNIEKKLPAGVKQIHIVRGAYVGGPMFNASGLALYFTNKTIECIQKKFNKKYACNCPIELLIHSKTRPLIPAFFWLSDVQKLVIDKLATSPFRRVWIFDYIKSEIVYVYP